MVRFTDVNLKLVSNIEKYQFVESTIRGDISMILGALLKLTIKVLKIYNAKKPTLYVIYLEANNLYGDSRMQLPPTEILGWVNPKDNNLDSYSKDSPVGCFLQVDLDCTDKLLDLHNHYLLERKITDK